MLVPTRSKMLLSGSSRLEMGLATIGGVGIALLRRILEHMTRAVRPR
jgi:hypothetical protein